jgi:serine/threonine-protein kinase
MPMPRAPDLAGSALDGRYELLELLGEGSFGRVYRGRDLRLGRAVAVKVIKPWWAEDDAWVGRFQREARLLARVNDPGVVRIYDFGEAEEGPYYVAELVEGESLSDRLRRGPLAPEDARAVAGELCAALGAAHREGVLHCDVKPANVLLGEDGRVRVGDFGVARLAEGTSQAPAATVAGTPLYMSPEQARGLPTTAATDVYSAGVVLYEMLAGRPPFSQGSVVELGLRHLQDPPPPLPASVPGPLQAVVEKAMAKEPRGRYADGREMARALSKAAPGANGNAPRTAPAAAPAPAARDAGTTRVIERGALATQALDRGAERTKVIGRGGGGGAPPPVTPRAARRRGGPRRRRAWIALAALLGAAIVLVAVLLAGAGAARTTVPDLRRLPRGGVQARAKRLHVRPVFSERHAEAPAGIAIAQNPAPGARVDEGSDVRVVMSSGPPPVPVPNVVGRAASSAESAVADAGLRYSLAHVAAPGTMPGTVVRQSPTSPASAPRGSTIALSLAETPEWRTLTTFAGTDDGNSVAFRVLGSRWRVLYDMRYKGTCLLIFVCDGPSAQARAVGAGGGDEGNGNGGDEGNGKAGDHGKGKAGDEGGGSAGGFELNEGEEQSHVFTTGPGVYELRVSGGRDSAQWAMTVQDYY